MYYFNRSILHKIKQDESFLDYRKYEIDEDYIDLKTLFSFLESSRLILKSANGDT